MRKYVKHKDFTPIDFIEKKNVNIENKNNKFIFILLIANIIMFPTNIKGILYKEEKVEVNENKKENYIDVNSIEKWLSLDNESILSFNIKNSVGEIILNDNKDINNIEALGFKIKKYTVEDDKVKVEVNYD